MMSNFDAPDNSPLDGIWWQVEFPTLIDPKRTDKVTEVSSSLGLLVDSRH